MKDERVVKTGVSVRQRVSRILSFLVLYKYCLLLCCATLFKSSRLIQFPSRNTGLYHGSSVVFTPTDKLKPHQLIKILSSLKNKTIHGAVMWMSWGVVA